MPSGMSIDAASTLTTAIPIDAAAAAGVANGASVSPSHARAAKTCRMVIRGFTSVRISQQSEVGKIVFNHYADR